jgi:PAS domain S-box-containing protein
MSWLNKVIQSGVVSEHSIQERRPIILSNYISLLLAAVKVIIFIVLPGNHNISAFLEMLFAVGLFFVPILLNRFQYHTFAKLYLCWVPPLFDTWFMLFSMQDSDLISSSTLDGLRFYLLAYGCIPYLILEPKNILVFAVAIAPSFICLTFPGILLRSLGLRVMVDAVVAKDFVLGPLRSFISYVFINASCFFLRMLVKNGELLNEKLIQELTLKKQLLSEQTANEVNQLNEQLKLNLKQASEREFVLNQSQKIARVGSFEYQIESGYIFLSDEMYNIFGIGKGTDFHPDDIDKILGQDQRDLLFTLTKDLMLSAKGYELTLHIKTPFKHRKWVRFQAFPIEEDGQVKGIRGIGHDITIYKESEELLKANEQKYRSLFEQASDAITIMDMQGRIIEVNERMTAMVDYSMLELTHMNLKDLLAEEKQHAIVSEFQLLAKEGKGFDEWTIRHRSGKTIEVEANVKLFTENRIMAIVRDITERKRNQAELILSQANLNSTINNTGIMICSVNRESKLITFNRPFFNYVKHHYDREVKPGDTIFGPERTHEIEILNGEWQKLFTRSLSGEIVHFEETRHGRDLQYSLNPIIEASQIIGVSIFVEDISERNQYIREIAEANRQLAETKLVALRSVMSPHFIFNVLSSIQYYIAKSDRQQAIHYLSTFSKLIRSVLNQSVSNKVKLSDEIELLKNYVELELSRFENKFDFVLDTGGISDVEDTEIPSLLIQPYVENAILHGLYNKKEKGTLWIRFMTNEQGLIVEVEDNGIGRQEAMKIKQSGLFRHKSMGLKLTEERLKLINQYKNTSLEVVDLKNKKGEPAGTRIRITIQQF